VRELVGYLRFDTQAELKLVNEIRALDQVYTNHLLAQQKLAFKQRSGAKVTKCYDRAQTPHQRQSPGTASPTRTADSLSTQWPPYAQRLSTGRSPS
jgi:hypothetical protein